MGVGVLAAAPLKKRPQIQCFARARFGGTKPRRRQAFLTHLEIAIAGGSPRHPASAPERAPTPPALARLGSASGADQTPAPAPRAPPRRAPALLSAAPPRRSPPPP